MSRDVWMVAIATAFLAASFMGMQQLLKAIYVLRLGFGPEFMGLYFATGALSFSLSSIPGGMLGARLGPRRMMIAGALTMLAGAALLPAVELIPSELWVPWLLFAQIIGACGWATFNVNQMTALMTFTTDENRKFSYSFRESMAGFGTLVGALIGGMLPAFFAYLTGTTTAQPAPYRYALIATVFVGLMAMAPLSKIGVIAVAPKAPTRRAALPPLLPLAILLACGFLNHSAMASSRVFYPAYFDLDFGLPTAVIGLITSAGTALAVATALLGAPFARKYGSPAIMLFASLGLAGSLLLMALTPGWVGGAMGVIIGLALMSMWLPNYQMRLMEMADPAQRALVAGAGSMAMSLGFASMSFNGGHIAASAGYNRLFMLGSVLAIASAGTVWLSLRVQRSRFGTPIEQEALEGLLESV
jgi:MFS family permease